MDVFNAFTSVDKIVLFNMRLPKTLTCFLVGACLGLSGLCMQNILKNPIASPFTLGISSAASFGASLSILTGFPFLIPNYNIQFGSILFSFIGCALITVFLVGRQATANRMVLIGVAVNFFFSALQAFAQYAANERDSQKIVTWIFGSISRSTWDGVLIISLGLFIALPLIYKESWKVNLLMFSDEKAQSMGIQTTRLRIYIFLLTSFVTAIAISYVGTIGFIGLLAPHFSRLLVGNDFRYSCITSILFGSLLLLLASVISKNILPGTIIPVGIITSIVGVPFMCVVAWKGGKTY